MKFRSGVLIAIWLLHSLASPPVWAATDIFADCVGNRPFHIKATTYNSVRTMTMGRRADFTSWWLSGYVSGISKKKASCGYRIAVCMDSTSPDQRVMMVDKKANEKPETWGGMTSFGAFIYQAFVMPCLKGEIPLQ